MPKDSKSQLGDMKRRLFALEALSVALTNELVVIKKRVAKLQDTSKGGKK